MRVLPATTSTNDVCHQLGEAGHSGTAVLAEFQENGRGQHGRSWSAPERSAILMSLLLRPPQELDQPQFLTAWTAVCIARVLARYHLAPQIKWPNDVLVDGYKICGILVERRKATVVGIGLNVSIRKEEFPSDLRVPATSLEIVTGKPVDRTGLVCEILNELDSALVHAQENGSEQLYESWEDFSLHRPGDWVTAITADDQIVGTLMDLRPDLGASIRTSVSFTHIAPPKLLRVENGPPVQS